MIRTTLILYDAYGNEKEKIVKDRCITSYFQTGLSPQGVAALSLAGNCYQACFACVDGLESGCYVRCPEQKIKVELAPLPDKFNFSPNGRYGIYVSHLQNLIVFLDFHTGARGTVQYSIYGNAVPEMLTALDDGTFLIKKYGHAGEKYELSGKKIE